MSLKLLPLGPVPELTARVARAAFPKENPYLRLRDELGHVFHDGDFADLSPRRGQPALSPWKLALVTVRQFAKTSPFARPPMPSAAGSTGITPSGSSSTTPASTSRSSPSWPSRSRWT